MRRADKLTTFMCRLSCNLEASTAWNRQGKSMPVMILLYPYIYILYIMVHLMTICVMQTVWSVQEGTIPKRHENYTFYILG